MDQTACKCGIRPLAAHDGKYGSCTSSEIICIPQCTRYAQVRCCILSVLQWRLDPLLRSLVLQERATPIGLHFVRPALIVVCLLPSYWTDMRRLGFGIGACTERVSP